MPPWDTKKALSLVKDRLRVMKSFRQGYEQKWNTWYGLYRAKKDTTRTDKEGRRLNNLFIPKTYFHIETEMSQIMDAFFSARPMITVQPREPNDSLKAQAAESLVDYQIFNIPHFTVKFSNFIRDCLIYGTSMAMVFWKTEWDSRGRLVYDNPEFMPLDIFDWWVDPLALTLDEAHDIIRRVVLSRAEIEDALKRGWFTDKKAVKAMLKEKEREVADHRQERLSAQDVSVPKEAFTDRFEFLEYWTPTRLVIVDGLDPKFVVRDTENPFGYLPFVIAHNTPDRVSIYSISDVSMLEDLQREYNTKRQQRIDNVSLALKKGWLGNRFSDTDWDTLANMQHGSIVLTDDPQNALVPIDVRDVTSSVDVELALLDKEMEDTTAAYDVMRGQMPSRKETATAVVQASHSASSRFRLKLQIISDAVKDLAQQILKLNTDFMDTQRAVRILGDEGPGWVGITREDLDFNYDLVPTAEGIVSSKAVDREQFMRFAALAIQAFGDMLNRQELLKKIAEKMDIKDIGALIQVQQGMESPGMPQMGGPPQFGGVPTEGGLAGAAMGNFTPSPQEFG